MTQQPPRGAGPTANARPLPAQEIVILGAQHARRLGYLPKDAPLRNP